LAEAQLDGAIQALVKRDSELASRIVAADSRVDELEHEVHDFTVRLLALRQPMAQDLRSIVCALKVSGDLERIADYAANAAKRVQVLNQLPPAKPVSGVPRLARLVQHILKEVLDAYVEQDVERATKVWTQDEEVDEMYTGLFRELITYMMEDARNITACIHLMFIAKNIERIGDHATNIAETIHFLVNGVPIREARPKGASVILPDATA
jgi:phosphate transport system protein